MFCSKAFWLSFVLVWTSCVLTAQKPPMKFGKIDPSEIGLTDCSFEPGAAAEVLCDYGEGDFEIQGQSGFVYTLKRHKRVKIFTKTGLDEANVELIFYSGKSGDLEKIRGIKAACHWLENGAVRSQELSSKDIYTTDAGHGVRQIKFAIPGAREGCVVEYLYELSSRDIASLRDWFFQGDIPVLHSEYRLTVPNFFTFQKVLRGGARLSVNEETAGFRSYSGWVSGADNRNSNVRMETSTVQYQWAVDTSPSIRREPYTAAPRDYTAHLEFQLLRYQFDGDIAHDVLSTYQKFNEILLESDDFGGLAKPGNFEKKLVGDIAGDQTAPVAKAGAILRHIQEKIKWNGQHGFFADQSAAKVYDSGTGDAGEINLLLVSCLRAAGLKADPVILGTREYGRPHPLYPKADKFDFVVAAVDIDGKTWLADATSRGLPLGYVAEHCLHGDGWRVSDESPGWTPLQQSALGAYTTFMQIGREGDTWAGKATFKTHGYAAAEAIRKVNDDGEAAYIKTLQYPLSEWNPGQAVFSRPEGPFATLVEMPVHRDLEGDDILYFKPVLAGSILENPFTLETRSWPLDLPYNKNFNYVLTLTVPDGYQVAEMPQDALVTFGENKDLVFQYRCSIANDQVTVISKMQMKRGFFLPEEYADLRRFYDLIVQKNQEMLVFKKV